MDSSSRLPGVSISFGCSISKTLCSGPAQFQIRFTHLFRAAKSNHRPNFDAKEFFHTISGLKHFIYGDKICFLRLITAKYDKLNKHIIHIIHHRITFYLLLRIAFCFFCRANFSWSFRSSICLLVDSMSSSISSSSLFLSFLR